MATIRIILHGKAAGDARLRTAVYTLRKDGHGVEVRVTWEPGDAARLTTEVVAEAGRCEIDCIVAGGGDGTINEVFAAAYAAGLPGECSLGVLPLGTANDFAHSAGVPTEDLTAALRIAASCAFSMYQMTRLSGDLDFWFFATSRLLVSVGVPLIFIPITVAAYDGIPHARTDQASAIINAARNVGGSFGISLANNVLAHREQFHQTHLVEHAIPSGVSYQNALQQLTQYFVAHGSSLAQAQQQAIGWIAQKVQLQAAFLAYVDVFWVLMVIATVAIPVALVLRKVKLGGRSAMAH